MDYDNDYDYDFPHDHLDAWTIARQARTELRRLMASLPRGYGDDKEQLKRASGSVVRNICEGAARRTDGEKRQHFNYANAEAAETAGTVQTWIDDRVVDINSAYAVICLYGRVGAMMHGLIRKHGGSPGPRPQPRFKVRGASFCSQVFTPCRRAPDSGPNRRT